MAEYKQTRRWDVEMRPVAPVVSAHLNATAPPVDSDSDDSDYTDAGSSFQHHQQQQQQQQQQSGQDILLTR